MGGRGGKVGREFWISSSSSSSSFSSSSFDWPYSVTLLLTARSRNLRSVILSWGCSLELFTNLTVSSSLPDGFFLIISKALVVASAVRAQCPAAMRAFSQVCPAWVTAHIRRAPQGRGKNRFGSVAISEDCESGSVGALKPSQALNWFFHSDDLPFLQSQHSL